MSALEHSKLFRNGKKWALSKNYPLVRSIRSELQLQFKERPCREVLRLVEDVGFEKAFEYALLYAYIPSWRSVAQKLRSIGHLMRNSEQDFLECWLQVAENTDDVLVLLYDRNRPFVRSLWKRGVGTIRMQVEVDGIICFASDQQRIVCANHSSVWVFSAETGLMIHTIVLEGVRQIQCTPHGIYLANSIGLFLWDKDILNLIYRNPIQLLQTHAGWLGFQDDENNLRIVHEDIIISLPEVGSVMCFCQRGLAVAVGTESGTIFLYEEGISLKSINLSSKVGITALFWRSAKELWIGDEEGGVWFWNGNQIELLQHLRSCIISIGYQNYELMIVSARGHVVHGQNLQYIPECFSAIVQENEGILCSLAHNRCSILLPQQWEQIENAFWVGNCLWVFGGEPSSLPISEVQSKWFSSPNIPFVYVDQYYALDNRGCLWILKDDEWCLFRKIDVTSVQKAWINSRSIWIQTPTELFCFDLNGVCLKSHIDTILSSRDGIWQIDKLGDLRKEGYFVRGNLKDVSHLCVYRDLVVVAQGRFIIGFADESLQLERTFADTIISMEARGNILVLGLRNRRVEVFDLDSMSVIGSFRVDGSISSLDIGTSFRILVRMDGGGLEVLMVDGITR